ncbi:polysaccharide deacetylase family protein [Oceaniglobus trochenteri]|uniref:polysaccharide deacetylase family protein n=1 Tax=Oceaniglobus trochenteri TaxID=2763260 RepID=UPI001D00091B|nr:polysaccharide deacetylase family protein [Oceaniglobus trochenteri]
MIILPRSPKQTAAELAQGFRAGGALRLLNFHATPSTRAKEYRRQIAACAERYRGMGEGGIDAVMRGGTDDPRPVLIPILFEGFRDNYDVLLPILEEFGFRGWFFVPSHFLNVPVTRQRIFAARHNLHYGPDEYPGERIVLSWAELRDARARGHFVACHSRNHTALFADTPDDILHEEIVTSKEELEQGLGASVDTFCYLHGAEFGLNPRADRMLIAAGYRYLLSNFRIQKLQ